jgi:periplasmic copper chaperone A
MKIFVFLLGMFAYLTLPTHSSENPHVMIMDISVPASLTSQATSGIVYFSIMNHGTTDDTLLSVATPAATSASLHESYQDGDIAKMRDLASVTVPADSTVKLEQGGKHVMLTGLKRPMKPGDDITLQLVFAKAGVLNVEAKVGAAVSGHIHAD